MSTSRREHEPIPESFDTLDELDAFWSAHSLADYEGDMAETSFRVRLQDGLEPQDRVVLSADQAARLRRRAHESGVSARELLDRILAEALPEERHHEPLNRMRVIGGSAVGGLPAYGTKAWPAGGTPATLVQQDQHCRSEV